MRVHLPLFLGLAMATAAPGPAALAEVVIGFASPLSGPFSETGERNRIAVEMAVGDLNANGGVLDQEVELVAVDDGCGMQQSIDAARALVAAGVRLVIGHMCSHSSLLAAGIYETADRLMITPFSTHPRLTEEGRQNVFRLKGRDDDQGRIAGDFLADRFAGRRIAILHDGSTYGERLAQEARKQLRARGKTEVMFEIYSPAAQDYSDLLARLRRARIEVLYVGGYGPDAGLIVRTARELGDDLQLVGGDGVGMDGFWSVAGESGEHTIFTERPEVGHRPDAAALLARFRERGLGIRTGGLGTYAAVQVWAQAVERAGTFEPAAVASMLRRGRFDTVLGAVAFDRKGDLEGAAWQWHVWTDGAFVPLEQLATQ